MPIIFAAIAAAGAIAGAGASIAGGIAQKSANEKAADVTEEQAKLTEEQTNEQVRRFSIDAQQKVGMGKALVGASGFASGYGGPSSMSKYVDAMSQELNRESSWLKTMGYRTAANQRLAADAQRSGANAQFLGSIFGAGANALSNFASIGSTAFGTKTP